MATVPSFLVYVRGDICVHNRTLSLAGLSGLLVCGYAPSRAVGNRGQAIYSRDVARECSQGGVLQLVAKFTC
jgi:hypothetical protein